MKRLIVGLVVVLVGGVQVDGSIVFTSRDSFMESIGTSITDGYFGYAPEGTYVLLTNLEMNSVLGETRYETISFTDWNLVGQFVSGGDGTNYCSGCNGNTRFLFDTTSLTVNDGVFGVGVDFIFHTSLSEGLGVDGTIRVTYTDGSYEDITIPADIGFFEPEVYFLGITDERGIQSLTIGIEPLSKRHSWIIDNLTIAAAVSEPATFIVWSLLGTLALTVGWWRQRKPA